MKITYATMSADDEDLQSAYDAAVKRVTPNLGAEHPLRINGEERMKTEFFEERSPIDRDTVVGRYSQADDSDVDDAVAAAVAYAQQWEETPWEERVALMRRAADLLEERTFDIAAEMAYEVGKNRLESLGDVAETIEFFRYYAEQMEEHDGFTIELGKLSDNESNVSVLRPFGVWAVIAPFNFPLALASGGSIGAMLTGNTVVLKPSNQGALMGVRFAELMADVGLPDGVLHLVTGGDSTGDYLAHHPDVDGLTFTGSYEVGMYLYNTIREKRPKPVVAEMGGKNPAIVTKSADLDVAAEGIARGAFGFSGQKCSATSRVYVEEPVYEEFLEKLVEYASGLNIKNPIDRDSFTGPVIDEDAVQRFRDAVEEVTANGGEIRIGGTVLDNDGLERGNFVAPTVATAPEDSYVWSKELFVPFVVVGSVKSLEEALAKSNDTPFGLTAGLFSGEEDEIVTFFRDIDAGTTYVNRSAGATTGAWPDIQSFGGWKGSGTSGAGGGGPWYLRSYLREQSRTRIGT